MNRHPAINLPGAKLGQKQRIRHFIPSKNERAGTPSKHSNVSREAAKECSPRRKPWVSRDDTTSPEGA
jgi:hypothetical protein